MDDSTQRPTWMDDELVKNISAQKLEFLEKMFRESRGKSQREMMAFLIPMMKRAKHENLTFTIEEMNTAITAIKKHSTQEEIAKMEQILEKAHHNKRTGGI